MFVVFRLPLGKPQLLKLYETTIKDGRIEFENSVAYTEHARDIIEDNHVEIAGGAQFTQDAQAAFNIFESYIDSYWRNSQKTPEDWRYVRSELAGVRRAFVVHLDYYGNSG